jgi:hypothetical protein
MDTPELHQISTFDCVSNASMKKAQQRQLKAAAKDEERAHAWKLSVRGQPD